ncbi:hypothetical protein [Actinomadura flavalba]|uniref:hypothetical protein n=1 Tax=Actinomadura flavalba TaxID=1120938 RepID=UPI000524815E|nr:hypothetical protein [Actinomadura flavalba]
MSHADDIPLQYATPAATISATSSPDLAAAPGGPGAANVPAPSIAPSPTTTASDVPSLRRNPSMPRC